MHIIRPSFDKRELDLLQKCLDSGWVTQGPMTREFEKGLATVQQVRYALATTSCTAALNLATMALDLGPGDEVIVPAFTWITSANAAEYVGAKAVFVDVDPATFNIDPVALEASVTPRTRAIVAVHLFGLAAPMDEVLTVAAKHGLAVIEDAACAVGTTYHGRPVGGIGDVGCFSFHPRKVITTGEGGMVTTNDEELSCKVGRLRNHGASASSGEPSPWKMNEFDVLGHNLRLSDIQAAVGLAQLEKLDALLAERRAAARRYTDLLHGVNELALPTAGDTDGHSYQSYVVRLLSGGRDRRNAVMRTLAENDIETRPGTHAVHRLGYYAKKYRLSANDFPNASLCEDTTITLPNFPGISEKDQDKVASLLTAALAD